jgi:hypothetical protein
MTRLAGNLMQRQWLLQLQTDVSLRSPDLRSMKLTLMPELPPHYAEV